MIDWNIQSRAHACAGCSEPFHDKQVYHTLLFDERIGYQRQDLCERCWSGQGTEATSRKGFVSHWQGVFKLSLPQPELIRKDTAESLLRKLIAQSDPSHLAAIFILAVMLERKRLLKVKDQLHQPDGRFFVYEQPKTGDVFTIKDPSLSLDQLEAVQRDVAHLLEHGLPDSTEPLLVTPVPAESDSPPSSEETSPDPVPSPAPDAPTVP